MIGRSINLRRCLEKSALWSGSVLLLTTGLSAACSRTSFRKPPQRLSGCHQSG